MCAPLKISGARLHGLQARVLGRGQRGWQVQALRKARRIAGQEGELREEGRRQHIHAVIAVCKLDDGPATWTSSTNRVRAVTIPSQPGVTRIKDKRNAPQHTHAVLTVRNMHYGRGDVLVS